VFSKFNISNNLAIKVATHLKIPYADNMLNVFRQKDLSYTYIQNMMYRIANKEYVSYFYTKNSLISYYRQLNKYEGTFLPNTTRNTYKFIEIETDTQDTQKSSIILAKSTKNKWHAIAINIKNSTKKHDIIIKNDEVSDNTLIEHIKCDLDILNYQKDFHIISDYPLYDDIFVILRYTNNQIILYFLNISESKFDSILWDLNDIDKVVFDIIKNVAETEKVKNEILDDNIVQIDYIFVYRKEYLYGTCFENTAYVRGIRSECIIKLKGDKYNYEIKQLYIYITMEGGSFKCYWDFSYANIRVFEPKYPTESAHNILCKQYLKNPVLFMKKYTIRVTKKCNEASHNDYCYYIKHSQHKQEVIKIGSWLAHCVIACIENCSSYHYKNYYIIICNSYMFKLAIVDQETDFIGIMTSREFFPLDIQNITDFEYYYSSSNNKVVFLSKDLAHLFFLETKKIDDIFSRKYKSGCKQSYESTLGLIHYFSVSEKLLHAIKKTPTEIDENIITVLIGAYIDRKSDKLYIVAKYKIEDTEFYGLFMWDMADNDVNFSLLYTTLANKVYNKTKKRNREYIFDISKLILWESEVYEFRRTKLMNLDMVYGEDHCFISMKYNRISHYMPVPSVFQFETSQCYAKSVKNVAENVIVVYYDCSRSYPNSTTSAYHYFIPSSMSLVKKIPTVKI